ncbi:MAG TPA: hypothetical protein P5161_04210 [Eubacteriales bacterium]|jgi:hypothetical protein|nr:hypothetical protein [Clostridia bacterium]HRR89960.1 hypothetical protein [Eubacteriales bacterium]HRU84770.1 hypothetical protein [Eubacteriales bacterium]
MTVKQILGRCLVKLGETDFTSKPMLSESETATLDRLLSAANFIYHEICANYLPQIHTEAVELDGSGELQYSALERRIIRPLRLIKDGYLKYFKGGATKLQSDFSGAAELVYSYLPPDLALNDTVDDTRLLPWIFEDGICGEYAFQNGLYEMAAAFDTKFRDAAARQKYRGRNITWRARRWTV